MISFYVGRWSSRRELRGERISSDCDRQDNLFHDDSLWLSSHLRFFQSLTRSSSAAPREGANGYLLRHFKHEKGRKQAGRSALLGLA